MTTLNLSPLTHAPNDLCRFVLTCFIELSFPLLFFLEAKPYVRNRQYTENPGKGKSYGSNNAEYKLTLKNFKMIFSSRGEASLWTRWPGLSIFSLDEFYNLTLANVKNKLKFLREKAYNKSKSWLRPAYQPFSWKNSKKMSVRLFGLLF